MQVKPYSIVLADDHAMVRDCIKRILAGGTDVKVVGEAGDGLALLELLHDAEMMPDMIILDLSMPNLEGMEATRTVKEIWPDLKILILTVHREREYVDRAIAAGAKGYLLKDEADTELFTAIDTIRQGGIYISRFFSA